MFNENPSFPVNWFNIDHAEGDLESYLEKGNKWHFEFRGYGEMKSGWGTVYDTKAREYLQILMNLWQEAGRFYVRNNVKAWTFVEIEPGNIYKFNEQKIQRMFLIRHLISDFCPEFTGESKKRTHIQTLFERTGSFYQAVQDFDDEIFNYSDIYASYGESIRHVLRYKIVKPVTLFKPDKYYKGNMLRNESDVVILFTQEDIWECNEPNRDLTGIRDLIEGVTDNDGEPMRLVLEPHKIIFKNATNELESIVQVYTEFAPILTYQYNRLKEMLAYLHYGRKISYSEIKMKLLPRDPGFYQLHVGLYYEHYKQFTHDKKPSWRVSTKRKIDSRFKF
jgi:hypothetical protein